MGSDKAVREAVKERYAAAARSVLEGSGEGCCGGESRVAVSIGASKYAFDEIGQAPDAARLASLGCGNPVAVAQLSEGEVVLDLGSGGGLDVLLSARRVGPSGKAYGLDMTDEMLELARQNQRDSGVGTAEFLKGDIENIPLADDSVDVIISNCVINLSTEKPRVFEEAHRVLRPGGRFAVSDIVTLRPFSEAERANLASWAGCVAGALTEDEYRTGLESAGFGDIEIEVTERYTEDVVSAVIRAKA